MKNTTLCYIYRDDEVLMLHRTKKENDVNHDKWIGVGGHFEEGESPEDCLLREVREETGLTLLSWCYRGIVTFVQEGHETEFMHLFTSTAFSGELTDCDEGDPAWIRKADFDALPQWEGDRIFLSLLEEEIPFFSLKLNYTGDRLTGAVLNEKKVE